MRPTAGLPAAAVAALLAFAFARRRARDRRRWNLVANVAVLVLLLALAAEHASLAVERRARIIDLLGRQQIPNPLYTPPELRASEAKDDGAHKLGRSTGRAPRRCIALKATILTEPVGRALEAGGARMRFEARVTGYYRADGTAVPCPPIDLPVSWYGPSSIAGDSPTRLLPRAGEGWRLNGALQRIPGRGRDIAMFSTRPTTGSVRDASADASGWLRTLLRLRRRAAERLAYGIEPLRSTVLILQAMMLGYRSELPVELSDMFAASGTVHVFAISGLHIAIVAGFLTVLLPLLRVPRDRWAWVVCPALALYTVMVGARPSAVRACVMASLVLVAPAMRRRPDPICAMAAAAILILMHDPTALRDIGFLFSFTCVFGILVLTKPVQAEIKRWRIFRPVAPTHGGDGHGAADLEERMRKAALRGEQASGRRDDRPPVSRRVSAGAVRVFNWLRDKAADTLAVSFVAWLVSAPLSAYVFGRLSPVSVLNNLFAVILATGTVLAGACSLVLGLISPWFSEVFNAAAATIELIKHLVACTARIPFAAGDIGEGTFTAWWVAAWYLGCILFARLLRRRLACAQPCNSSFPTGE